MSWETIRGAGKVRFSKDVPDGSQVRITNDFLDQAIRSFTKRSVQYYNFVGEMAFAYHEKQLHSMLFSAISDVADAAFLEQHTLRKFKGIENKKVGWIDYWALYRNTIFLIEVKHDFNSSMNDIVRKKGIDKWSVAIDQIDSIDESEAFAPEGYKLVKIALMVVVNFIGTNNSEKISSGDLTQSLENSYKHKETLKKDLKPLPNWSAVWHLHDDLLEPLGVSDGRWEIYPSVNFFAHVDTLRR